MSRPVFELYRFTNPDGSAKEWAFADLGNGRAEIRWGKADHLVGHQVKSLAEAEGRAEEKQRKGYRYVGRCLIGAPGAPAHVTPPRRHPPTLGGQGAPTSPAPPTPTPAAAPVDLVALLGGDNDGSYF